MARPKEGLDYFPLDVGILKTKNRSYCWEFGIKGELAVIKLLCAIYKKDISFCRMIYRKQLF